MKLLRKLWLFCLPFNKIESAIWISDEWSIDYFHWLTDALPRMIVTEELIVRDTVILPDSFQTKPYIQESLDILGFKVFYNNYKRRLAIKPSVSHRI
jgi:capsular polysaccharide biosynthesis protein